MLRSSHRLDPPREARSQIRRLWPQACAAAAAAVLLLGWLTWPTPPHFSSGGEIAAVGDLLRAGNEPLEIDFSRGDQIRLASGTRARVSALVDAGARLTLEGGALEAAIVHSGDTRWSVEAGPYTIDVTGTRFSALWEPQSEHFRVHVFEGSVEVKTPDLAHLIEVRAGETLDNLDNLDNLPRDLRETPQLAHLNTAGSAWTPRLSAAANAELGSTDNYGDGENWEGRSGADPTQHTPESAGGPAPTHRTDTAISTDRAARADRTAPTASAAPAAPAPPPKQTIDDWKQLAHAGRYAEALAKVELAGFETICNQISAPELLQLADVGRYARKTGRSVEALKRLRARFPGSDEATAAAFTLGRLYFERHGRHAEAADLFSTYLAEKPHGALREAAMGRLIEAHRRAGQKQLARSAAHRYLAEYPSGAHAEFASGLTSP